MENPLVTVCLITYNHEKYIRQAIDGVLSQKVNFDWELIIADDCSTDNTRRILLEYQRKYPQFIKLILQNKNVGPAKNWLDLITSPKSKYIAYFEGDDYWIDDLKLQKQIDFLEANSDFSLCHSDVVFLSPNGDFIADHSSKLWNFKQEILDYRFAIYNPLAFSCTAVFRNQLPVEKLAVNVKSGDWMTWVLLTLQGKAKFINEKMAVYRDATGVSVTSIWHKNYNYRALFLLKLISINYSYSKNKWLLKGAMYYWIVWLTCSLKINYTHFITQKLKYNLN
jgi:glycosyltransferase involved in cell wall biosynthesis